MRHTLILLLFKHKQQVKWRCGIPLQYHCHKAGTGRAEACEIQHSLVETAEGYSPVPPKDKTEACKS